MPQPQQSEDQRKERKAQFKQALEGYKSRREVEDRREKSAIAASRFKLLSQIATSVKQGLSFSCKEKTDAAQKMITALDSPDVTFEKKDIFALRDGNLGRVLRGFPDALPETFKAQEDELRRTMTRMRIAMR